MPYIKKQYNFPEKIDVEKLFSKREKPIQEHYRRIRSKERYENHIQISIEMNLKNEDKINEMVKEIRAAIRKSNRNPENKISFDIVINAHV